MTKQQFKRAYAPLRGTAKKEYGVFVWRGDSKYFRRDALKVYALRSAADAHVSNLYPAQDNLVVRELFVEVSA